jgi:hypothetical protein
MLLIGCPKSKLSLRRSKKKENCARVMMKVDQIRVRLLRELSKLDLQSF